MDRMGVSWPEFCETPTDVIADYLTVMAGEAERAALEQRRAEQLRMAGR